MAKDKRQGTNGYAIDKDRDDAESKARLAKNNVTETNECRIEASQKAKSTTTLGRRVSAQCCHDVEEGSTQPQTGWQSRPLLVTCPPANVQQYC